MLLPFLCMSRAAVMCVVHCPVFVYVTIGDDCLVVVCREEAWEADHLTMFDGSGTAGAQLGRLSGTALPAPITSCGQFMTLQFTSSCCSARLGGFYASIAPGGSTLQTCAGQQAVFDLLASDRIVIRDGTPRMA